MRVWTRALPYLQCLEGFARSADVGWQGQGREAGSPCSWMNNR
ncbi:MAG: hypothetical protein P9L94_13195 [Candidatus Hinthialibacter antarcticus]|nr:hypothetical protein [Candidatus Hinthialibacter antarcticus]